MRVSASPGSWAGAGLAVDGRPGRCHRASGLPGVLAQDVSHPRGGWGLVSASDGWTFEGRPGLASKEPFTLQPSAHGHRNRPGLRSGGARAAAGSCDEPKGQEGRYLGHGPAHSRPRKKGGSPPGPDPHSCEALSRSPEPPPGPRGSVDPGPSSSPTGASLSRPRPTLASGQPPSLYLLSQSRTAWLVGQPRPLHRGLGVCPRSYTPRVTRRTLVAAARARAQGGRLGGRS